MGATAPPGTDEARASSRPQRASTKRKVVDLTDDDAEQEYEEDVYEPVKKGPRKQSTSSSLNKASTKTQLDAEVADAEEVEARSKPATKTKAKSTSTTTGEEKRQRRFRAKAPQSFAELFDRATTQRMFVLHREQTASSAAPPNMEAGYDPQPLRPEDAPTAKVHLAGSTGNIYEINIKHVPTCSCPHYQKHASPCKHVIYVLHHVLKAPENLVYQLAFITSELVEIFQHAPPVPCAAPSSSTGEPGTDGNRKPIEDDCPICCCEFEPHKHEEVVFCKAACGNNIHKTCFDQWAASKRATGDVVTCPFCRSPWQADVGDLAKYATSQSGKVQVNEEGYVNIANELGISGQRDYSTYHPFWVREQIRNGLYDGDYRDYGGY